jgi:hypothetical protein
MRRRQGTAVAAALVVAASAVAVYGTTHHDAARSRQRAAVTTPTRTSGAPRPLTYAVGRTIHFGDRSIRTGVDVLSLDVVDDGAAFTTFDGLLWFTDGRTLRQIGLTTPGQVISHGIGWSPAGRPNDRIVADYSGTRLAWLEYTRAGKYSESPQLVVYDSRLRRRVARVALGAMACPNCAHVVSVHGDHVDWTDVPLGGLGTSAQRQSGTRLHRYDLSSRRETPLSVRTYQAELRRRPRTLVVGDSVASGTVGDTVGQDFVVSGRHLVASGRGSGRRTFDPRTGTEVGLHTSWALAAGRGGERFYLFEWLDDDTVALLAGTAASTGTRRSDDMLVCTISSGRCTLATPRPDSSSPIVPEFETPGAGQAEARAARARVLSDK